MIFINYDSELVSLIQTICRSIVEQNKTGGLLFATITNIKPLTVETEKKLVLDEKVLVVPEHFLEHTTKAIPKGWKTVRESDFLAEEEKELKHKTQLEVGDKVILQAFMDGQKFCLIGKVKK